MSCAVQAEGLGKRYRIGRAARRHDSIRDLLASTVAAPIRNLRRVRSLNRFDGEDEPDVLWALRDVSFEIRHGETVGVIGQNGAGKSTLLKVLSRITHPSTGRAVIRGRVGSLLEVGTGFHPDLTGRENTYLNGAILGMDKAYVERRFDEIVAFAGVERFVDTPVRHYSSGMYLRLAFAVAAHLEPEILIVDEVLAVGDAAFQRKCLGKMGDVASEGRTVLFVSHNLAAVRSLCTRGLLIQGGRLVADDAADRVVSRYVAELRQGRHTVAFEDAAAPRNDAARIRAVSVRDHGGRELEEIHTSTPFRVDVEYETLREGAVVGLGVFVHDLEGNCLFSSFGTRDPEWLGRPMPRGSYRSSCYVPGNLLNNRWVSISLYLYNESMWAPVWARDILRFEVLDDGEARAGYFHIWEGAVRPLLDWSTEPLATPSPVPAGSAVDVA